MSDGIINTKLSYKERKETMSLTSWEEYLTMTNSTEARVGTKTYDGIKRVSKSMLHSYIKFEFAAITNNTQKAMQFNIYPQTDEPFIDEFTVNTWFPKSVLSNLDAEEGTVYIWSKFVRDKKPELLGVN